MKGAAAVAWHILPVSDMPFFPRGLWEAANEGASDGRRH